jgi:tRNA(fMet)-specific endonuclease VapC
MAILIDADVILEAERGRFDIFRWLEQQPEEEFLLAAITVAELWRGVERVSAAHRPRLEHLVKRVLEVFEVLPYTEGTAREHARLWAEVERTGFKVGAHDLVLAAVAIERGDAVATFSPRHFAFIPDLKVIQLS